MKFGDASMLGMRVRPVPTLKLIGTEVRSRALAVKTLTSAAIFKHAISDLLLDGLNSQISVKF